MALGSCAFVLMRGRQVWLGAGVAQEGCWAVWSSVNMEEDSRLAHPTPLHVAS